MDILSVNGSPRGSEGNTEQIVQSFLTGAAEAGADTETIYLVDKHIHFCKGCFTCWKTTPGVCIHDDDIPTILDRVRDADIVVYATPLYVGTVSGHMKVFMDRHLPLLDPHMARRGAAYLHPPRYSKPGEPRRMVLISNSGYPEHRHFSGLVETFRQFTADPDSELIAVITCAAGEMLGSGHLSKRFAWYLDAARTAGNEIVEQGEISEETQRTLDSQLIAPAVYVRMTNAYWDP